MQTSRSPQEMTRAITTLMEKMNLLYPHSFIMMSSARKYHTMMQLFMRVQVAALFPVRDASDRIDGDIQFQELRT